MGGDRSVSERAIQSVTAQTSEIEGERKREREKGGCSEVAV